MLPKHGPPNTMTHVPPNPSRVQTIQYEQYEIMIQIQLVQIALQLTPGGAEIC